MTTFPKLELTSKGVFSALSGGSRGRKSGHGPHIQFGYRLWPPSNEKISMRYWKHIKLATLADPPHDVGPPSRMSGSASAFKATSKLLLNVQSSTN